jgi:hypothetical protein
MTQNHRAPRQDVVDVAVPIDVVEAGAFGALDKPGLASDGAEGAHRTIYTPGDQLLCIGKQLGRTSGFHNGGAQYHAVEPRSRKRRFMQCDEAIMAKKCLKNTFLDIF